MNSKDQQGKMLTGVLSEDLRSSFAGSSMAFWRSLLTPSETARSVLTSSEESARKAFLASRRASVSKLNYEDTMWESTQT